MPTCPAGHSSGAADYCDVCGTRMTGPVLADALAGSASAAPPPVPAGNACPDCSTPRTGRFCEGCGYDFAVGAGRPTPAAVPPPPPPPAWSVSVPEPAAPPPPPPPPPPAPAPAPARG